MQTEDSKQVFTRPAGQLKGPAYQVLRFIFSQDSFPTWVEIAAHMGWQGVSGPVNYWLSKLETVGFLEREKETKKRHRSYRIAEVFPFPIDLPVVACPMCKGRLLQDSGQWYRCLRCGGHVGVT